MLALMPRSPPIPDLHTPTSMATSTMSVALLPSAPMTYGQQAIPTLLPQAPPPSKRPKLSLNTSNVLAIFGKESTSQRLDTLSATSPTVRNTFQNAHNRERTALDAKRRRPALTPLATHVEATAVETPTPSRIELPGSADTSELTSSSAASETSVSTIDSLTPAVPYKISFNVTSVLSNGPIPRTRSHRLSFAQSRPMFPAAKKVGFRAPLTEDIRTEKYTMKHSDIDSSTSTISTLELSPAEKKKDGDVCDHQKDPLGTETEEPTVTSPQTGDKRESSDEEEEDSDKCPATPVAGRKKRHRQWVWTLGPVELASEDKSPEDVGVGEERLEEHDVCSKEG